MPAERVVRVSASSAQFIAGGGRDAEIHTLHDQGASPGDHVRVVEDKTGDEVALAVADIENGKLRVMALPSDGFAKIDGALLGWRVERALAWRQQLGLVGPDTAYHLLHGGGDNVPGFTCDVLGKVAVIYAYSECLRALGKQLLDAVIGFAKLDGGVVKLRARGSAGKDIVQDVAGKVDEAVVVTEHGVPYEVHPLAGLNVGLFTDMREHRRSLARFAAGKRVLNLFSYTGSLSIACARAGAAAVTSVDTSAGVQAWAQGNFIRSGLDWKDPKFKFETGEAGRYLARAVRDKERYDIVLIDPPATSSAAGVPWVLGRDYPELIAKAAEVIPSDGMLWLASNAVELGSLGKLAHKGLRVAKRSCAILEQGGLPPEYPTPAVQQHDRYLQTCILRLS